MHALVTIHDVMPETLMRVERIISDLPHACREHLVLLVVPGREWQPQQLDKLRQWQRDGVELAGHGWHHRIDGWGGLYHRLHGLVLSRTAAEHLSFSAEEIIDLMARCHRWFGENDLGNPEYYVPPAWAAGFVDSEKLCALPWRYLEVTGGIHDLRVNSFRALPLCGFEADTGFRAGFLTLWNRLQAALSSDHRPLRLSLHPDDPDLRVAGQMQSLLGRVRVGRDYRSLFTS